MFETKENVLLNSLLQYFGDTKHRNVLISVITETSHISLRILDWFVTNYAKEHSSVIMSSTILKDIDIYNSYKSQLKAFNKKMFDPFCRKHSEKQKFPFYYDENNFITTTIGQLNFFRWAIENKVIDYVTEYYDAIKQDLKCKHKKTTSTSSTSSSMRSSEESTNLGTSYIVCFN